MTWFPIDPVLPDLRAALATGPNAVLLAPPGAGKTTRVPLALLDACWLAGGRILMLEPRRMAARAAARFMAASLGEAVGETVGYRVRLDSAVGPRTRVEVITEGILTRRLQDDPALEGVGAVILDEFHERSLQGDLGLALCLDSQGALRPDLRLLVMSATLDALPVAALLGNAPVIESQGRQHPVTLHHHPAPAPGPDGLTRAVTGVVRQVLAEDAGDLLVFLPGEREIGRVARALGDLSGVAVLPLHGSLPAARQDAALTPRADGHRRVVLATTIAETSLTIEGVRGVIDSGLARVPRFDPGSGLTRLETVRVSQASAAQRAGRAGRLGPGVCHRLWPAAAHGALVPSLRPEILDADLAPLVLDLAAWGVRDPAALAWLDPPPAGAWAAARDLLAGLGALDTTGRVTNHGRALARLPLHPRLAHMVIRGQEDGLGGLAADIAALLSDRDLLGAGAGVDLRQRLDVLRGRGPRTMAHPGTLHRVREAARQIRRLAGIRSDTPAVPDTDPGRLLALAYPDRVARRRDGGPPGRVLLSGGRGATLDAADPLAGAAWLAVGAVSDRPGAEARVRLAAPLDEADVRAGRVAPVAAADVIQWSRRDEAVLARRRTTLGALVLRDQPLADPDPAAVTAALLEGVRVLGLESALPWTPAACSLRARVGFVRHHQGAQAGWPDLSDAALTATLDTWLGPFVAGMTRRAHLQRLDLTAALRALLPWDLARRLDDLAPRHVTVPTGARLTLDYGDPEGPALSVRVQEVFGLDVHPTLAGGRVPVVLRLLSPARRPVQVTRDLPGFWRGAWAEVRKEMKGRYPKHPWPEDPVAAAPTTRAKPRGGGER
ncbi:ATP-dependent helicase HrpB [Roseospira visakhapatnamensis]|uniref:ATP-dependent helicase HrpB n=1 Tax=Roseospira visakhapatnamensis TaxID=390880 RepID=A0A7W6RCG9_9PROT|nr:ATP-dependent helicase HrpB [Roseospira visakhapatnamensis]MBB4265960.1 ATP-dependent helicase HrpB [Roseospira visakhapatnamensis]